MDRRVKHKICYYTHLAGIIEGENRLGKNGILV
jgi:hypothetical protein